MGDFLGGLIGAAGSFFGGQAQIKEQDKINNQNIQEALDFAQHGIQWKVADAKAAGINPLAALGVSSPSAPVSVGADVATPMASAGQNLGRAASALMQPTDKDAALRTELLKANVDAAKADVVSKNLQNARMAVNVQPGTPPGLPSHGIPIPRARPGRGQLDYNPPPPLFQTFRDQYGNDVYLPSEKAASPLQTLGAAPVNVGIAAGLASHGVGESGSDFWHGMTGAARRFFRNHQPPYSPDFQP